MKNMLNGGLVLGLLVLAPVLAKADNNLYIVDLNYKVGVVDLTTDKVTVLGSAGAPLHDIGFTANGNFYGTSLTALYSLSLSTGAASLISNYPSGLAGSNMSGLVGDGSYLLGASGVTKSIYAIGVSPFSTTTLTGAAGATSSGDITFGPAGASGPLYDTLTTGYLDKITISGTTITSVTPVGNTGHTNISGLATIGSVTYAVAGTEVYIMDLNTAALTPLFNYSGHGLTTVAGAAAAPSFLAVPEPSNIAMLLAGVCALAVYQSRKRARA